MSKPLSFYTINDITSVDKFCKKKGLKPHKTETKMLDGVPFEKTVQYSVKNVIYDVLECDQCYSGYMTTLMRQPKLPYEELLQMALYSKYSDEREGAIGIILKDYSVEFEKHLSTIAEETTGLPMKKEEIQLLTLINTFIRNNTSYVWQLKKILCFCDELTQD